MTSYEMAIALAKALDGKKGQDIKVLKTEELTTQAKKSQQRLSVYLAKIHHHTFSHS